MLRDRHLHISVEHRATKWCMEPGDQHELLTFTLSDYSLTFGTFAKVQLLLAGELEIPAVSV